MFWDFKNHSRYIKSWKACLKSLKCYDDRGWNKMRFRNPRDLTSPASQSRDLPKWRQCVPAVLENIVRGVWIKRMVASLEEGKATKVSELGLAWHVGTYSSAINTTTWTFTEIISIRGVRMWVYSYTSLVWVSSTIMRMEHRQNLQLGHLLPPTPRE